MSDTDVLRVVCPNCDGERVRLVSHGDRFTPSEYEECKECEGLGFVPSDALNDALTQAIGGFSEAAGHAVLRLIQGGMS